MSMSRRDAIVAEILRRCRGMSSDVEVRRRAARDETNFPRLVSIEEGDDTPNEEGRSNLYESNILTVTVRCFTNVEEAVADTEENPLRELDRLMADVHRVVLAAPTELGLPGLRLDYAGSTKEEPNADNRVSGAVRFTVRYEHDYGDPDTYTGVEP